jgi:hypothetical protein
MNEVRSVVTVNERTQQRNEWKRGLGDGTAASTHFGVHLGAIVPSEGVPEALRVEVKEQYETRPMVLLKLNTVNPEVAAYFEIDGIYEVTFRKIGQME